MAQASIALATPPVAPLTNDTYFIQGVQSYEQGRYDDAIEAFGRGYKTSADYRFLYNLAQAYVARWKPVEALEVFERYLTEGNTRISTQRRLLVAQALAQQRNRIARLELQVSPKGATVKLDGRVLGTSPLAEPIPVAVGEHNVAVSLAGYRTVEQTLQFKGQEQKQVSLSLAAEPVVEQRPELGQLAVDCPLAEVQVFLDERQVATTPLKMHLLAKVGLHTLSFERSGYRRRGFPVQLRESTLTRINCDMEVTHPLNPMLAGTLKIDLERSDQTDPNIQIFLDGKPTPAETFIPSGLHAVEVHREGYAPWQENVLITPGKVHQILVTLQPTSAMHKHLVSDSRIRRHWAYGLGAAGVASLGGALGVGLWNRTRWDRWRNEQSYVQQQYDSGPVDSGALEERRRSANDLLRSAHTLDVVTAAMAVAGGLLVVGAGVLYFGSNNPDQPVALRRSRSAPASAGGTGLAFSRELREIDLKTQWQ